jgi:hypothetical protein
VPGVLTRTCSSALVLALVAGVSACGDSDDESKGGGASSVENELALTIAETGKTAKYTAPKTAKGGVTTVKLTNDGKKPHEAQLLRIEGDHTPQDVFKAIQDDKKKNEWLRAEGGVGRVPPGGSGSATVLLKPGRFMVADLSEEGPPAYTLVEVTAGPSGSLPTTDTTVTAAEVGDHKYKWEISGPLKSGQSTITFKSEGKEALHFVGAARLSGKASKKQVEKALAEEGPPPKFIDEKSFYSTAILDGEKSEVTQFSFSKPGKWVLFCPLPDRGQDVPHTKQGLVEIVDVK